MLELLRDGQEFYFFQVFRQKLNPLFTSVLIFAFLPEGEDVSLADQFSHRQSVLACEEKSVQNTHDVGQLSVVLGSTELPEDCCVESQLFAF